MTVKIGNKEVQITDYLSANQIQKALYETYEQGYQDGGFDMEQAKQIIIDELLKQIDQIRADAIEEFVDEFIKRTQLRQMTKAECIKVMYDIADELKKK